MHIHWFPGHMAKTRRLIEENLKLVDCVAEIIDARIPKSSRSPEIDAIVKNKPRLIVMNKSDLADPAVNELWLSWFEERAQRVILTDSALGKGVEKTAGELLGLLKEKIERDRKRGITNRPVKAMVVGIPNVGKSSFINRLAGRKSAKVGDRPGVTRGKQWISLGGVELLDMPGILWPKFDDQRAARFLAFTGAIKDEILDPEALAAFLLEFLRDNYAEALAKRYKIEGFESLSGSEILILIAKKRSFVLPGGEIDTERAGMTVLDEFRSAKIGRISLEKPTDE